MTELTNERADFEAWCIRKGYSTNKWHNDCYVDSSTQNGWEVWQAASRATPPSECTLPPTLESAALTDAITAKLGEFYPQATPFDMEKNQRLARAIQRLPQLREQVEQIRREAVADDRQARGVAVTNYGDAVDKPASAAPGVKPWAQRQADDERAGRARLNRDVYMFGEIADLRARLARQSQAEQWAKTPPTDQGEYWNWDGDEDHAPMIYHVLWSGTAKKCFVSIGQYGISQAIWCDKFGGWWKKIDQPSIPADQGSATDGAEGEQK